MLQNILNRNKDKLTVMVALSCHGIDFVSDFTPQGYTTSDALIISYRGYNLHDLMQTRRICKAIDKWAKKPTYTFLSYGHAILDGGATFYHAVLDFFEAPIGFSGLEGAP